MSFLGVSAPKGTPTETVDKRNAVLKAALADAGVKQRIESTGAIVISNSASAFQQQVRDELEVYRLAVKQQGLKPE